MEERDPNYLRLLREGNIATRSSKRLHREHRASFEQVQRDLRELGLRFDVRLRYHLKKPISAYDLVITIGGDGTFLETSHYLESGVMLGINSAPSESVGYYCRANRRNFRGRLIGLLRGRQRLQKLARLEVEVPGRRRSPLVLNDILFTNRNPAGTTRYRLRIAGVEEEQKSSGIWIAPAPGSTAAIHSAGGKVLPLGSDKFQFVVREAYLPRGQRYRFLKRVLGKGQKIRLLSMMDDAALYLDGPHHVYRIRRGDVVTIRAAGSPLYAVW